MLPNGLQAAWYIANSRLEAWYRNRDALLPHPSIPDTHTHLCKPAPAASLHCSAVDLCPSPPHTACLGVPFHRVLSKHSDLHYLKTLHDLRSQHTHPGTPSPPPLSRSTSADDLLAAHCPASSHCKLPSQHLVKLTPHRLRSQHAHPGPPPHPPRGCPPCWQGCQAQRRQPAAVRPRRAPPAAFHVAFLAGACSIACQAATQGKADMSSNFLLSKRLCTGPGSQSTYSRPALACEDSPAALHAQLGRRCHPGKQLSAWQG